MDVLLAYEGRLADRHELDFYDAARALSGFQRSLALTTHLILTGEIIHKAPALKGARILIATPKPGSWEVIATIIGGAWVAGTATKETPFGHLLYSVYDYVIRQTMGFPVDYSKSLYQQHEEQVLATKITPAKLDSLTEKVESSVSDMHRPIVASKTADHAGLFAGPRPDPVIRLGSELNYQSYDYISHSELDRDPTENSGVISSYNINTFSGRVFDFKEGRTIPFELELTARSFDNIRRLTTSLRSNALDRLQKGDRSGAICLTSRRVKSSSGRLKGLRVQNIREA